MSESDQLHAVMFADISGSSALYKQAGNIQAKSIIDKAMVQMKELTVFHQGIVVKTMGDEVMARFDKPEDACLTAIAIQQQCGLTKEGKGISIRIGMNYGPTLMEEGDIFGDTVNDAAYVAHIARAKQTVITQAMVDALPPYLQDACQEFDRINIKGDHEKSRIFRLQWETTTQSLSATTVMYIGDVTEQRNIRHLEIIINNRRITIAPEQTPYTIGRDNGRVNLCIDACQASRNHCQIVFRRGKYVLEDHSTNGTYVTTPDQAEIYLRREELPLFGEGAISIGRPIVQAGSLLIQYFL